MCRRGRRYRSGRAVYKVACGVCKRRVDALADDTLYDESDSDGNVSNVIDCIGLEYVCKPCGEWLIPRAMAAFDAAAKALLAQVREVRKLERLVLEDA